MRCPECNGTGKVTYVIPGDSEPRSIGWGYAVQMMDGYGTRACKCVSDLPPIYDQATWWESESVYSAEIGVPIGGDTISVRAEVEVPRNDTGRRCHRTAENCYYPALIDLEVSSEKVMLFAATARELAAVLIAAADECEKADTPVPESEVEDA